MVMTNAAAGTIAMDREDEDSRGRGAAASASQATDRLLRRAD